MKLADEMTQLTKEYEDSFFDPELFKYIISLVRKAAKRGECSLLFQVIEDRYKYSSLINHLQNEGFEVRFIHGPSFADGTTGKNSIYIIWG